MKYNLINSHSVINFHDAYINGVYFQGNNMIWELFALQTTNIESPDKRDDDWYIKNAVLTFENASIDNIVYGKYPSYDEVLKNISYENHSYIYGMINSPSDIQGQYKVGVITQCEIYISFSKSILEWNEFAGFEWMRNKVITGEHPN